MAKGGKVLLGGKRDASRAGNFFIPTVIANVDHNMRVMTEEVSTSVDWSYVMREVKHRDDSHLWLRFAQNFGPIIGVQRLPRGCSVDDAIALINSTRYTLV